jgi:hypothetical protein
MEEEWAQQLRAFVEQRLEPAEPRDASSAAEVREAFFHFCGGSVPKREVGLKLARKGFSEETIHHGAGLRRVSKRAYRVRIGGALALVRLRQYNGGTGGL